MTGLFDRFGHRGRFVLLLACMVLLGVALSVAVGAVGDWPLKAAVAIAVIAIFAIPLRLLVLEDLADDRDY
jgi:hypothetical protein